MRQESKWRHWAESTRRPYELPSTIRCVFCLILMWPTVTRFPPFGFRSPFLLASLVPHLWPCSLVKPASGRAGVGLLMGKLSGVSHSKPSSGGAGAVAQKSENAWSSALICAFDRWITAK